jgi:hypothetical protein
MASIKIHIKINIWIMENKVVNKMVGILKIQTLQLERIQEKGEILNIAV